MIMQATPPSTMPLLIPEVQNLELKQGVVVLPVSGTIAQYTDAASDSGCFLAQQLQRSLSEATGSAWNVSRGGRWKANIALLLDSTLPQGSYRLDISTACDVDAADAQIRLCGSRIADLRDAVQTLRQLIAQYGSAVPCMHIEDSAAYAVRSYSLDVTRGRVPTMQWLHSWIDKLCLYKYNQLQLYVEHSTKIDGLSESWRGSSPLSSQDFIELDQYCAERGIDLVPSISTFGHHYMTLRTHSFRDLGEFPEQADRPFSFIERQEHHTININHPEAFALSCKLIDSYIDEIRSVYFNIGGDETFDLGKGRSREGGQSSDPAHMYAGYVERLCRYVQQHGHQAMLWGDIAVEMPEILDLLPPDVVVLNWLYSPDVTDDKVRLVAASGVRQYVCAAVHCWNSLLPHFDRAWLNISKLAAIGLKYHAEGFMVTDWGDYGHINDPRMSIPAMIYGAQEAWKPGAVDVETVDSRISVLEYGDLTGRVLADMKAAASSVSFAWENAIHLLELDDGRGGVNADVLQAVNAEGVTIPIDIHRTPRVSDVQRAYLQSRLPQIAKAAACNGDLHEAQLGIIRDTPHVAAVRGAIIQPWLVALEGQCLLNELGYCLAVNSGLIRQSSVADSDGSDTSWHVETLPERLETWFESYSQSWKSLSRESELRRIADVVWQLADTIRIQRQEQS